MSDHIVNLTGAAAPGVLNPGRITPLSIGHVADYRCTLDLGCPAIGWAGRILIGLPNRTYECDCGAPMYPAADCTCTHHGDIEAITPTAGCPIHSTDTRPEDWL